MLKKTFNTAVKFLFAIGLIATFASCKKDTYPPEENKPTLKVEGLSDTLATYETKRLYQYLKNLQGKGMLVGQQFFTYYRQSGTDDFATTNSSDCKTSTGSHPAMLGVNYDFDPAILRAHIINTYRQGGIVTVHWTTDNPVTGGDHHDLTPAVSAIIKGGAKYEYYKSILRIMADFYKSLKDDNGKLIPIIFRPYHENFSYDKWWGADHCTAADYVQLYRQTISYLRDSLNVHNLITAYAPNTPSDYSGAYGERYPGDDVVDIMGFDRYGGALNVNIFANNLVEDCRLVVNFAEARNKVAAITEAGVGNGIQNTNDPQWFTKAFGSVLLDPVAKKVVYWLTWSNNQPGYYFIPLPGQLTYDDFKVFANNPYTLFLNDLPNTIYHD